LEPEGIFQRTIVYVNRLKLCHDPTLEIRAEIKDQIAHDDKEISKMLKVPSKLVRSRRVGKF